MSSRAKSSNGLGAGSGTGAQSQQGFTKSEIENLEMHLEADVRHDFSGPGYVYYIGDSNVYTNVAGTNPKATKDSKGKLIITVIPNPKETKFKENHPGVSLDDETSIMKYFFNPNNTFDFIENHVSRLKSKVIFPVSDQTDTFQESQQITLISSGNQAVGIVQDAGKFITTSIGAQNVITFGSILDPAGKPIAKEANPIWYNPGENASQEIGLKQFGFNNKIKSVTIQKLKAGTVSAVYNITEKNGDKSFDKSFDAISMKEIKSPTQSLKIKPINDTKIDNAGFFTSIAKAEDVDTLMTQAAYKDLKKYMFYAGKTLGDTFLVASCMPKLKTNDGTLVDNVFVPTDNSVKWLDWTTGEKVTGPAVLMLKTGDRLNHVRAFIKGVGTIYETRLKSLNANNESDEEDDKVSKTKYFEYIPGKVSSKSIAEGLVKGYDNLITDTTNRYNKLIDNFKDFLETKDGVEILKNNAEYSDFIGSQRSMFAISGGSTVPLGYLKNAAVVILDIIETLEYLRDRVVGFFNDAKVDLETNIDTIEKSGEQNKFDETVDDWSKEYKKDLHSATLNSPRTIDIIRGGGKCLHRSIIVAQGDEEGIGLVTIHLLSAFEFVKSIGSKTELNIKNTEVYEKYKASKFKLEFSPNRPFKSESTAIFGEPTQTSRGLPTRLSLALPTISTSSTTSVTSVTTEPPEKQVSIVVSDQNTMRSKYVDFFRNTVDRSVSLLTHIANCIFYFRPEFKTGGGRTKGKSESGSGSGSGSVVVVDTGDELLNFINAINSHIISTGVTEDISSFATIKLLKNIEITEDTFPRLHGLLKYTKRKINGYLPELFAFYNLILDLEEGKVFYLSDYTIAYQLMKELDTLFNKTIEGTEISFKNDVLLDGYELWKTFNAYACRINHELMVENITNGETDFSKMERYFNSLQRSSNVSAPAPAPTGEIVTFALPNKKTYQIEKVRYLELIKRIAEASTKGVTYRLPENIPEQVLKDLHKKAEIYNRQGTLFGGRRPLYTEE